MAPDDREHVQAYHYKVTLDSIEAADFTEVRGLSVAREVLEVEEGGENRRTHKRVGQTRYSTILLRSGSSQSSELIEWIQKAIDGTIERRSGSILALDRAGDVILSWDFREAFPCRYQGADLSAAAGEPTGAIASRQGQLAIEVLELAHRGFSVKAHPKAAQRPAPGGGASTPGQGGRGAPA